MNFLLVRLVLWFATLALFPVPVNLWVHSFQVEVLSCTTGDSWGGSRERRCVVVGSDHLADRVLVRLQESEEKEIDPWLRDDIRIAWITVKWAQSGIPDWAWVKDSPHAAATFQVLKCRPEEVWPRIMARRQAMLRAEYKDFFGEVSSPRKAVRSVTLRESRQRRNAAAA